jgi:hypothetical protein
MKYISIIPAIDWFFVHKNSGVRPKYFVNHLAAWALTDEGESVGLLPASDPVLKGQTSAKLVEPPPIKGEYIHKDRLTADMQACLQTQN